MGLLGGIGQTLLFLCALALLGIVGSLIYSYAARCFLSIVQDSSAGNEKIEWGNEPFIDWLFRGGYLLYLTLVWLAPVGIILRSIDRDFFLSQSPLAAFIAGIVLWLFFPLGALSSMSATSQWVIFRWSVVRRFFGQGAVAGQFYMLSLALLVLGLGPWMLVLATGNILLFFFAGICSMAAFLMYARLLGRMAWILSGRPKIQRRKPRERKDIKAPVPKQEEKVEEIEEIEELEEVEEIEEVNIPPRPLTQERFTLPEEEEVEELPQFALVEEEKKTVAEEEDGDELKLKPLDDGE